MSGLAHIIVFVILALIILGAGFLSVMTKSIMRAATYLLIVLFSVAGIYFMLGYSYLGAAQISVYAGGITIMYVFAIQLVSKRTLQNLQERFKGSRLCSGLLVTLAGLALVAFVLLKNQFLNTIVVADKNLQEVPMQTVSEAIVGSDKYQYILPFEFISVFLLACIVGGIMIARKEDNK